MSDFVENWPKSKTRLVPHHVIMLPLGSTAGTVKSDQIRPLTLNVETGHQARFHSEVVAFCRRWGYYVAEVTVGQSVVVQQVQERERAALDPPPDADLRGINSRPGRRF